MDEGDRREEKEVAGPKAAPPDAERSLKGRVASGCGRGGGRSAGSIQSDVGRVGEALGASQAVDAVDAKATLKSKGKREPAGVRPELLAVPVMDGSVGASKPMQAEGEAKLKLKGRAKAKPKADPAEPSTGGTLGLPGAINASPVPEAGRRRSARRSAEPE
jgi:hypothetical protein